MAAPKTPKGPKVGKFRGGTKTKVGGRGGFLGKTTSGGNLGRVAMSNTGAQNAAKGYGRSAADAAMFAIGGGTGGGGAGGGYAGGYGGAPGVFDNTTGAGVESGAGGLIESILGAGGTPFGGANVGGQPFVPAEAPVTETPPPASAPLTKVAMPDQQLMDAIPVAPTAPKVATAPTQTAAAAPVAAPVAAPAPKVVAQPGTSIAPTPTGGTRVVSTGQAPISAALYEPTAPTAGSATKPYVAPSSLTAPAGSNTAYEAMRAAMGVPVTTTAPKTTTTTTAPRTTTTTTSRIYEPVYVPPKTTTTVPKTTTTTVYRPPTSTKPRAL